MTKMENNRVTPYVDAALCVEMGGNGKKYVVEHHDVGKIIKQYKELFKELVKHKDAIPHD